MEVSENSLGRQYSSFQEIGKKHNVICCVKCGSYFVENNRCESCGHIQEIDLMGTAFGEKSVFFRKEVFVEERPWYFDYLSQKSQIKTDYVRQYKRFLSMRIKRVIQQYKEADNYHKLEFRFLVDEFLTWGGDISWVMGLISQVSQVSKSDLLNELANDSYNDFLSSLPEEPQRYKSLIMSVVIIGIVCGLSLLFFN